MMPSVDTPTETRPPTTLLKALADDNRLRMVALLADGELCVCHIAAALELGQPNVSQHLTVLRHAGLVERRRRGSWIHYHLVAEQDPAHARILAAILHGVAELAATTEDRKRLASARAAVACP